MHTIKKDEIKMQSSRLHFISQVKQPSASVNPNNQLSPDVGNTGVGINTILGRFIVPLSTHWS